MKIYRVSHYRTDSEHDTYSYHSNIKEANKAMSKARKEAKEIGSTYYQDEPQKIEVEISKQGILDLMNNYASYSDNG